MACVGLESEGHGERHGQLRVRGHSLTSDMHVHAFLGHLQCVACVGLDNEGHGARHGQL